MQQTLKDRYIPEIISIQHEGQLVAPPTPIAWFPDNLAWQMTTPKNVIRRFPPFASFQKFLVSETSVGNISRQEIVSMIPPLLMDVKPGMTVLDMCAAPGSKAAQLIEMVHGGEETCMRQVARKVESEVGREPRPDGEYVKEELKDEEGQGDWSDDGRSTGLLIANDADYKRAHMLIHQMKRLNSPNLIVTNHDATLFPSIKLPSDSAPDGVVPKGKYLKFDRILADVPCSGDGTCRKNVNVWKEWNPGNAMGLFQTQVRILIRALQMLKVGGMVVYSTCSMNPVENEAVVASAIERCGGLSQVQLVDCSGALPELKRKPGLTRWKVMDKQGKTWESWSDVERHKTQTGPEGLGKLAEGMFPTSNSGSDTSLPLERCMRVYGHMQDTGAFFITVLEKKTEIRAKPESELKKSEPKTSFMAAVEAIGAMPTNGTNPIERIDALDEFAPLQHENETEGVSAVARQNKENAPDEPIPSRKHELGDIADAEASTKRPKFRDEVDEAAPCGAEDRQVHWPPPPGAQLDISRPEAASLPKPRPINQNQKPKAKNQQPFEEPFIYLDPDHAELQEIYNFYKLSPRFPRNRFMVRNATGKPVKTIYYTSSLGRDILTTNEGKGIKFVHCGVKMFVKQDVQKEGTCKWRIQNEGLPILESWVGEERVVRLYKHETLHKLLVEMFPMVNNGGWKDLGEIGERVRDIAMGCCVLKIEKSDTEGGFKERMTLPLWRSLSSLNLMLPKEDRKAMLLRLFNDDGELVHPVQAKDRPKAKEKEEEKEIKIEDLPSEDEDDEDGGVPLDDGKPEMVEGEAMAETVSMEEGYGTAGLGGEDMEVVLDKDNLP